MNNRDKNSIRYMALRAKLLKLCGRLERDIEHYEVQDDSIEYDAGKLEEMKKICVYIRLILDEAEQAGGGNVS